MSIPVEIKFHNTELFGELPILGTKGACAFDIRAIEFYETTYGGKPDIDSKRFLKKGEHISLLAKNERHRNFAYFGVGFSLKIQDPNFGAFIIPRSSSTSLGLKLGNTIGLIDSDYMGPIIVAVENNSLEYGRGIEQGERIAQMYFAPIVRPTWNIVEEFSEKTERGAGGFGSTGKN